MASLAWAEAAVELLSLKTQRAEAQLVLSAQWQFELPQTLESALHKGVPLFFVVEAEVTRERWYFYDKRLAHAERYLRLTYLPLTQRWRLNSSSQPISGNNTGVSLAQSFDSLSEALSAVRRVSQWPIANAADVDLDAKHNLELRFRLDLTQLPRPLQSGMSGQPEWNLNWARTQRLQIEAR
jgi:hypothetical protein